MTSSNKHQTLSTKAQAVQPSILHQVSKLGPNKLEEWRYWKQVSPFPCPMNVKTPYNLLKCRFTIIECHSPIATHQAGPTPSCQCSVIVADTFADGKALAQHKVKRSWSTKTTTLARRFPSWGYSKFVEGVREDDLGRDGGEA
ncbi:hypothetical protein C8J56DRAFT_1059722 [Mycena floridula]|nr:hypothetical protein C8J56DRAFT_1059722 [Mycena floridula]